MGAVFVPLLLALPACACLRSGGEGPATAATPASPAAPTAATVAPAAPPPSAPAVAVPKTPPPSPSPARAAAPDSQIANNAPAVATNATPAAASPPASESPAKSNRTSPPTTPRPAPAAQGNANAPKPAVVSPTTEQPATATPLDIAALEQRLKETHAIGLFTKLSLKNQVDDLLAQFKAHYRGNGAPPLSALRERYDLLMLKVLSLLQDGDPALAKTIGSSREAIWGILSDPSKLAAISS
jgi:hypothetical protein